jgi:trimeric autotransporter adhesin
MKKMLKTASVVTGLLFNLSINAQQTLYVPNGTSGIGVSTNLGNVGIGTTTPLAPLSVAGTNANPSGAIPANGSLFVGSAATNLSLTMGVSANGGSNPISWLQSRNQGVANTYYTLSLQPLGGAIGIGTTLPMQTLDINGRIHLSNGVIQRGGSAITTTNDLGLYSLVPGNFIRFVTSGAPFKFYADGATNSIGNLQLFSIEPDGKVVIGNVSTPGDYKLYVQKGILTEKVKVAVAATTNWADHVFGEEYQLKSIEQVEAFVKENKHLPNIPSAQEVVKEGVDMAQMDAKLLEKIEELTLYMIAMKKENDAQKNRLSEMELSIRKLSK